MDQTPNVYISEQPSGDKNWFPKLKKYALWFIFLMILLVSLAALLVNWNKIQQFVKVNITGKLADYNTGQTEFAKIDSLNSNAHAKLILTGPAEAATGSEVQIAVILSADSKVKGADAVILYDPKVLTNPVLKTGAIFDTYPFQFSDQKKGRILISGVKLEKEAGFEGEGMLGSITFTPVKKGKTSIKLQFAKGQTTDSNVLQLLTGIDILSEVGDLDILIK